MIYMDRVQHALFQGIAGRVRQYTLQLSRAYYGQYLQFYNPKQRLVINRGDTVWQPDTFIQLLT